MKRSLKSNKTLPLVKSVSSEPLHEWSFEAIGTVWWIGIYQPLTVAELQQAKAVVTDRIEAFDSVYSRFRADSLVTKISQQAGSYELPEDSVQLLTLCKRLYDATNGTVTPLIGETLSDAGYDAQYSLVSKPLHRPASWDEALQFNGTTLHTTQPVLLDFGAAGKGYLVDIIVRTLRDQDVQYATVDGGGDMMHNHPSAALRVGLEHPDDASQVIGVAQIQNQALCGSAGNRRAWGNYTHIMDPKSLQSPRHIKAVWVVAKTALEADGLTTALFFCDPKQLAQFEFEYVIVNNDTSLTASANFPAELF